MWSCPQTVDVFCAGDSLFRRLDNDVTAKHKFQRPATTYIQGLGGDGVQHLRHRVNTFPRAQTIFLLCGTNDLDRHTPTQITATLLQMATELQNDMTEIFILGILPRELPDSPRRQRLQTVNDLLRHYCHQINVTYIDPGPDWLDGQHCNPTLYHHDLLHLMHDGNCKLMELIKLFT